MPGLHPQSRRKKVVRSVDMSGQDEEPPRDFPEFEGPTVEETLVEAVWWTVDGLELQIVVRDSRAEKGDHLVDFAVCLQARREGTEDGWADVERVDCSTGYVHVDREGGTQHDRSPVPENCRTNLEAAKRWALEYIWDIEKRLAG